jgi:hypothetical protein
MHINKDRPMFASRFAAAVLCVTFAAVSTVAAQEPLEHIPAQADLVLRLKAPQQTIEKVASLAEAVKPGAGEMVRQSASKLGEAIRVPGLAGVDQSRDWYIVLSAKPGGRPDVFFAIPTTDADKLTAALPERMVSRVEEDWVIYSGTADEIPDPAEPGSGISSVMTAESAAVFARGDLSLFINTAHLTDVYTDQIAKGRTQIDAVLQQIAAVAASQSNGVNMETIMGMYGTMIQGAFQGLEDSRGCSVAFLVDAEGLQIEKHLAFADGSKTAQALEDNPTSEMQSLSRLPAGAAGYFGIHGDMQRFIDWGWSINASLLANDPGKTQKFEVIKQQWQEIEFGEMVGAFELGSADDGLFQYRAIVEAQPISKVRDGMREMMDVLGTIKTAGMTQTMTLKPDAETIGSHSIDLLTVKQEFDPSADPSGAQQKVQEMMFGPGGMISRIAFLDGRYAQTMGGGREAMESLLKSLDHPSGENLPDAREGLNETSNVLVLVDVPRVAVSGLTFAGTIPDVSLPVNADELAQIELEGSYLGYTLATETDALRVRVNVPVEQFRGIVSLVELFRKNAGQ